MWRRALVGILLIALLSGGGWLAYGRFFRSYTIMRQFNPGEQWVYTITHSIHLDTQQATLSYQVIDTVQRVEPDGSALVERVLKADEATLALLQRSSGPLGSVALKSLWRCTANGKETPVQPSNAELFLATASRDVYPTKPVRKGQEWSSANDAGSLKTRIANRFEGLEAVGGTMCYKIQSRIESLPDSLPQAEGTMITYIDKERGWVRSIEATLQFKAGNFQPRIEFKATGGPSVVHRPRGVQ